MTTLRSMVPTLKERLRNSQLLLAATPEYGTAMKQVGDYLLHSDSYRILWSEEGLHFKMTDRSLDLGGQKISDFAYGDGVYLAVGENGLIYTSPGPNVYGVWEWTLRTPDASYTGSFFATTFGEGKFVIVGTGGEIQVSTNYGLTWTHIDPGATAGTIEFFADVAHGNGVFVVGGLGSDEGSYPIVQSSPDALVWTEQALENASDPGWEEGVLTLEFIVDRFIAIGFGEEEGSIPAGPVEQATNGIAWEDISDRFVGVPAYARDVVLTENRPAIIYDNGNVVAMLGGFDLQIGKWTEDGPDNFERVPYPGQATEIKNFEKIGDNYIALLGSPGTFYISSPHIPVPPVPLPEPV